MSSLLIKTIADFSTTLSVAMAVGATTGTLTSGLDADGIQLPTGTYGFTIDRGSASKEYITATLTGSSLTSVKHITRGTGVGTSGTTKAHRKGAEVIISDHVAIKRIMDVLDGTTNLDSATPLGYDGTASITTNNQIATKAYVDGVAVAGAPDASTTTKGIVEEATQAEVDAGTTAGATSARLYPNPSTLRSKLLSDYVVDTGAADAYVITPSPAITAYATGQIFSFKAANTNTDTSTINVSALGVKTIKKLDGATNLTAGDIVAGQLVVIEYNATSGFFQMISPVASLSPVGSISMYAGATAPDGWLLCDASAVSRTTYAALFAVLSTTYGVGDGSTTFNLPDMRGRIPVGVGTGTGGASSGTGLPSGGSALTAISRASWKGAETHVLTIAEMPAHDHTGSYPDGTGGATTKVLGSSSGSASTVSATAVTQGGGTAHNNIQPVMGLNFIIKA